MLIVPSIPFRGRRASRAPQPAPLPGPILTLATYDNVALTITLGFDQAIDISGLSGSAISVDDGDVNLQVYRASGAATLLDPQTVRIGLEAFLPSTDGLQSLNAPPGTGIVAADDGAPWAGAIVDLPYSV